MASLSASRTVISFWPEAYPLLAIDGVRAAARKAGRKVGAGREADSRREAGRASLAAAIVGEIPGYQRIKSVRGGGESERWPLRLDELLRARHNFFGGPVGDASVESCT